MQELKESQQREKKEVGNTVNSLSNISEFKFQEPVFSSESANNRGFLIKAVDFIKKFLFFIWLTPWLIYPLLFGGLAGSANWANQELAERLDDEESPYPYSFYFSFALTTSCGQLLIERSKASLDKLADNLYLRFNRCRDNYPVEYFILAQVFSVMLGGDSIPQAAIYLAVFFLIQLSSFAVHNISYQLQSSKKQKYLNPQEIIDLPELTQKTSLKLIGLSTLFIIPGFILGESSAVDYASVQTIANLFRNLSFALLGIIPGKFLHQHFTKNVLSGFSRGAVLFLLSPTIQVGKDFYNSFFFLMTGVVLGIMHNDGLMKERIDDYYTKEITINVQRLQEKHPGLKQQLNINTQQLRFGWRQHLSLGYDALILIYLIQAAIRRGTEGLWVDCAVDVVLLSFTITQPLLNYLDQFRASTSQSKNEKNKLKKSKMARWLRFYLEINLSPVGAIGITILKNLFAARAQNGERWLISPGHPDGPVIDTFNHWFWAVLYGLLAGIYTGNVMAKRRQQAAPVTQTLRDKLLVANEANDQQVKLELDENEQMTLLRIIDSKIGDSPYALFRARHRQKATVQVEATDEIKKLIIVTVKKNLAMGKGVMMVLSSFLLSSMVANLLSAMAASPVQLRW